MNAAPRVAGDFPRMVLAARNKYGWTLDQISKQLGVSLHTVQSWLKPEAVSRREAPDAAMYALTALVTGKPVTERRGALKITYEPASSQWLARRPV